MNSAGPQKPIRWRLVRSGVYVTTLQPASVNCGLVVGTDCALLIDTGSSPEQGSALRASIRSVTDVELQSVVVTHHHWDHAYGLGAFTDIETIGHESLALTLASDVAQAVALEHGLAPDQIGTVSTPITVMAARNLGGIHVEIGHFGPGHTQGDLAVLVPQARILFAGDLVEHDAPPQIDETTSLKNWPRAMESLLTLCKQDTIVVPGHGDGVDANYISWQGTGLDAVYGQCEWLVSQGVAELDAYVHPELQWPWDEKWVRGAIQCAYAELAAAGVKPGLPIKVVQRN